MARAASSTAPPPPSRPDSPIEETDDVCLSYSRQIFQRHTPNLRSHRRRILIRWMNSSNMFAYMRAALFTASFLTPPLLGNQRARHSKTQGMALRKSPDIASFVLYLYRPPLSTLYLAST
jgi:hypothetical protein